MLKGEVVTGKTTIAAYFAKHCNFPYVKFILPDEFIGYSDQGKVNALSKVFMDCERSEYSCIVLDNL